MPAFPFFSSLCVCLFLMSLTPFIFHPQWYMLATQQGRFYSLHSSHHMFLGVTIAQMHIRGQDHHLPAFKSHRVTLPYLFLVKPLFMFYHNSCVTEEGFEKGEQHSVKRHGNFRITKIQKNSLASFGRLMEAFKKEIKVFEICSIIPTKIQEIETMEAKSDYYSLYGL